MSDAERGHSLQIMADWEAAIESAIREANVARIVQYLGTIVHRVTT